MNEAMKRIAEGLKAAIMAEGDGYHFYMMAAASTKDPQGIETFQQLAQEELGHVQFLRKQYEAISKNGAPDEKTKLGPRAPLKGDSPIFSAALKARAKQAHYEMSALSIGIQLELNAQKFYQDMANKSEDPTVRKFFLELVEWEAGHYQALLRQQDMLREDYWAEGGFSPF